MKCALVTGGSRGIGKAICLRLSEMGFHIIINYRMNDEAAAQTLTEIKENGGSGQLAKFDVSNRDESVKAIENWYAENPEHDIEVLVNNAGIRKDALMVFMKNEEWDGVLSTNLHSFFNVTKPVLNKMVRKRFGRIVNVVSLSGIKGMAGQTNYSAAKAAVIGATKALAQEVGKRKITVNAVAPGFIATDMTEDIDEAAFKQMIPVNRFGKPEEVAEAVAFLASEKASYITGEVINVNGGLYT